MNITYTDEMIARLRNWIKSTAKPSVNNQAIEWEALDQFEDDVGAGLDPHYEMRGFYTVSGNPEIFCPDDSEFSAI